MNRAVVEWIIGKDTGASSLAIVAWMERPDGATRSTIPAAHPLDPADLGRCIRLLTIAPEYRARLNEMALVSEQWRALVQRWSDLEALYHEELPSGRAPRCYALMQDLLWPKRDQVTP